MAKKVQKGQAHLSFVGEVEQELAPILVSEYTAHVMLDLCKRDGEFNTRCLYFYKTAKIEKYYSMLVWIRFYPFPYDGKPRFQLEVSLTSEPLWTGEADTAEQALQVANANAKRTVAEVRAARRAAAAESFAAYQRRQAEASA
jgi:hypothetical protein